MSPPVSLAASCYLEDHMSPFAIFLAILAIGFLILIHEFGHYLVARALKMKVEVFSIGFGPALLKFHPGETEYRLAMLPLGGYVRIAGMAPEDGTPEGEPRSFANRPGWQRFLVLVAGPLVNWGFAFALLVGLFVVGYQVARPDPVIGMVMDGSQAAAAGLHPGDKVLSISGKPVGTWTELVAGIQASAGEPMQLLVERDGQQRTIVARTNEKGLLGVGPSAMTVKYPFGEAVGIAFIRTGEVAIGTIVALPKLFKKDSGVQLSGPAKIAEELAEAAETSATSFVNLVVLISLALALMNLLPVPGLDGGRLLFVLIEMVRRKPVNAQVEAIVHALGIVMLLGVLVFVTVREVRDWGSDEAQASPPAPTQPNQAPEAGKP